MYLFIIDPNICPYVGVTSFQKCTLDSTEAVIRTVKYTYSERRATFLFSLKHHELGERVCMPT